MQVIEQRAELFFSQVVSDFLLRRLISRHILRRHLQLGTVLKSFLGDLCVVFFSNLFPLSLVSMGDAWDSWEDAADANVCLHPPKG